jgi:hypothetical protein
MLSGYGLSARTSLSMNQNQFLEEISRMDFDLEGFTAGAIQEEEIRRKIFEQMQSHPHIMVYYNCFYVIEQVSLRAPELIYPFWDNIVSLLTHKNSYHRDFGLVLLANLTAVDAEQKFTLVFKDYLRLTSDAKFMTADYCIKNLKKIAANRPDLIPAILDRLLDLEAASSYRPNQLALLKFGVLDLIAQVYDALESTVRVNRFILAEAEGSLSPKTRKMARELKRRFGLTGKVQA